MASIVAHGPPPLLTSLEEAFDGVKGFYEDRFGLSVDEGFVSKDGVMQLSFPKD